METVEELKGCKGRGLNLSSKKDVFFFWNGLLSHWETVGTFQEIPFFKYLIQELPVAATLWNGLMASFALSVAISLLPTGLMWLWCNCCKNVVVRCRLDAKHLCSHTKYQNYCANCSFHFNWYQWRIKIQQQLIYVIFNQTTVGDHMTANAW